MITPPINIMGQRINDFSSAFFVSDQDYIKQFD